MFLNAVPRTGEGYVYQYHCLERYRDCLSNGPDEQLKPTLTDKDIAWTDRGIACTNNQVECTDSSVTVLLISGCNERLWGFLQKL